MKTLTRSKSAIASLALIATFVFALISLPVRVAEAANLVFSRKQPTTSAGMLLVATNSSRSSVVVQNVGTSTVYLSNLSTVTSSTGFPVAPQQKAVVLNATDQLYGIAVSSTGDLRIIESIGAGGSLNIDRLNTSGISNDAAANTIPCSDGSNLGACSNLIYNLSTAITANSTVTATASGTFAITSNATGLGSVFRSDGSKWQLLANYTQYNSDSDTVTIATTSTSDMYLSAPVTGNLTGIDFSSLAGLTADDTNYITFTAINLGQSGVGSTAMLAVSDANTTKATGGSTITALARRTLTVHGTAGNLAVVKGDVIRVRATATGTLVGTVTLSRCIAYFTRTV